MRYGSVCSGIEAATAAWHPLGWKPQWFSEIEKFPSAVLAHHYPEAPNLGDMTKFEEWPDDPIDLLVGGTPCQSFSVAGLRKGLDDPRGNLMLTFGAIAAKYRPQWLVWENVPGVLSAGGGRDFGTFLGMLGELGYGFAYRVLDAQFFGVPQRRRRVFVVGCLGDWRAASAVLFERHSMSGHPAPRREAGEDFAGKLAIGIDEECNASIDHYGPLLRGGQGGTRQAVYQPVAFSHQAGGVQTTLGYDPESKTAPTLSRCQTPAVAFAQNSRDEVREMPYAGAISAESGMKQTSYIRQQMSVRRLTPKECERLQGFPDGYTDVPYRNKRAADGPRYKALGNSMAVPVMRWIGNRVNQVHNIMSKVAA